MGDSWTADAALPGGEDMSTPEALAEALVAHVQGLELPLAKRWATLYGSRVWRMLGDARSLDALGEDLGQQLYAQEVEYLCRDEWAMQPDDILWRRTKLGLAFSEPEKSRLARYLAERPAAESTHSSDAA